MHRTVNNFQQGKDFYAVLRVHRVLSPPPCGLIFRDLKTGKQGSTLDWVGLDDALKHW